MSDPTRIEDAMSFLRDPDEVKVELDATAGYGERSLLLDRAQQRAEVLGLDLNAVLEVDAGRLQAFPTAACLTPPEVTAFCAGEELSDLTRYEHADSCEFCMRILHAARPTAAQRERFLDELGSLAERAISSSEAAPVAQPEPSRVSA